MPATVETRSQSVEDNLLYQRLHKSTNELLADLDGFQFRTDLDSDRLDRLLAEANYRRHWQAADCRVQGSWILGARYFKFDENFDPIPQFVYLGESLEDGLFAWIQIGVNASSDYTDDDYYNIAAYFDSEGGHSTGNGMGGGAPGGGNGTGPGGNGTMPSGFPSGSMSGGPPPSETSA